MNDYVNEEQQWEAIKDWWRKNGKQLIAIFVISLAIGLAWRYWQGHQLEKKQQASQLFDQLVSTQQADPNSTLIPRITSELENDYASTPYAAAGALIEAKNAVSKNDLPLAEKKLRWVIDHAKPADVKAVAAIRLARVLAAEKKWDEALSVLEKNSEKSYAPAMEQVKGDIYLAQGKTKEARTAYQNALNGMPTSTPLKKYVQMQLNQLPAH